MQNKNIKVLCWLNTHTQQQQKQPASLVKCRQDPEKQYAIPTFPSTSWYTGECSSDAWYSSLVYLGNCGTCDGAGGIDSHRLWTPSIRADRTLALLSNMLLTRRSFLFWRCRICCIQVFCICCIRWRNTSTSAACQLLLPADVILNPADRTGEKYCHLRLHCVV